MIGPPPRSTLFPHPPLSRSVGQAGVRGVVARLERLAGEEPDADRLGRVGGPQQPEPPDRAVLVARVEAVEVLLRSEEHTSELQSRQYLVCRLLLEKKKTV